MDKKPRKYGARVKLEITGLKPRYLSSQRAAVHLFREVNMRRTAQNLPPRPAVLRPVRGWEWQTPEATLTITKAGGVVMHRAPQQASSVPRKPRDAVTWMGLSL